MLRAVKFVLIVACALAPLQASAQTAANLAALKGLAPFATLLQTGALRRPTLLPFADQQQQALKDVFITSGDLADLADGLGTTLGAAYLARAHYVDRARFTNVSQSVADVVAYALATRAASAGGAERQGFLNFGGKSTLASVSGWVIGAGSCYS